MSKCFAFVTMIAVLAVAAVAGAQTVTKQNQMTATATIRAIDPATRSVTLRSANGDEDTFTVGPEVTRFNQLKVGDTITATYYESLVFQVRKPGAPAPTPGEVAAAGRSQNAPGGIAGREATATVTVKAIDRAVPSITVASDAGVTLTRKVADPKNLEGVNVGDKIDITFTQGVMVAAVAAKK